MIRPASPSGRRWSVLRLLLVLVLPLLLVAGSVAAVVYARALTDRALRLALTQAGLPPQELVVRTVGLDHLSLGPLQLSAGGPAASAAEISWTLRSLLQGRLAAIRIEGLRLALRVTDGALTVDGLPPPPSTGADSSHASFALPVQRLDFAGAVVTLAIPAGTARATFDASMQQAADGTLAGTATLDTIVTPPGGAPMQATLTLPAWQLDLGGSEIAITLSGGSLILPAPKLMLDGLNLTATMGGQVASWHLAGTLHSQQQPAPWPAATVTLKGARDQAKVSIDGSATALRQAVNLHFNGQHDLDSGRGGLRLTLAPLQFQPQGLQPDALLSQLRGTVATVSGALAASASLGWNTAGRTTTTTGTAELNLDRLGFTAGPAIVRDLSGHIAFDRLLPLRSRADQKLTASVQFAGLPPGPLDLRFQLPGDDRLHLAAARFALAGGALALADLDLRSGQPVATVLHVEGIDLASLFSLIDVEGLSGSGRLDGAIPVQIGPAGVDIRDGRLAAAGPGVLRYTGKALPAGATAGAGGEQLALLTQALADFHYTGLELTLNRSVDGDGSLLAALRGANPAVLDNYPFAINIRLQTNFDRLANMLLGGYSAAAELLQHTARPAP